MPSGVLLLPQLPLLFILVASYEGVVFLTEERRKLRPRDRFFCLSIVYVCFYLLTTNPNRTCALSMSSQLPLVIGSSLPPQLGEESDRLKRGPVVSQEGIGLWPSAGWKQQGRS